MEKVVECIMQHQGEADNQPEDGVMLGEEAGLLSRRQGSRAAEPKVRQPEKNGLVT